MSFDYLRFAVTGANYGEYLSDDAQTTPAAGKATISANTAPAHPRAAAGTSCGSYAPTQVQQSSNVGSGRPAPYQSAILRASG